MRRSKWLNFIRSKVATQPAHDKLGFENFLVTTLGIDVNQPELYIQAFRHVTVCKNKMESNERLEFIGDAVLDAIVADIVFTKFPDRDEGFLSKMKSAIVNRKALNKLSREMQLEPWIMARVRNRQAMHVIGGNVLEALIGAMYKDKGQDFTYQWIEKRIVKKLGFSRLEETLKDAKSTLYEHAHQMEAVLRFETLESSEGDITEFESTVLWNEKAVASARASSKKDAEQRAARKSLTIIVKR